MSKNKTQTMVINVFHNLEFEYIGDGNMKITITGRNKNGRLCKITVKKEGVYYAKYIAAGCKRMVDRHHESALTTKKSFYQELNISL